ncbi:MAG: ribosome-associated translation inhibitor RaiA [Candidatus Nomurabacteria bacterium]|nr:ribosome-associated translation inhibitor RaiA [Candidatus Nomurabacteria bacterium]
MKINLQAKNMELTPAIHDYVIKRVTNLGKLLSQIEEKKGEIFVRFNVSKTTRHHKEGEVFEADCSINIKGENFYSKITMEDLYQAIDAVKENLFNEIEKNKDRKQTLFRRGASSVKKMLKGLSKRNPFTSKY